MDIGDLQKQFEESSIKVIADLQKKCQKLEEENKHLQKMLEGTVPIIQNNFVDIGIPNERIICETQIALLKNKAIGSEELTMEEARKLQIYVDVLEKIKPMKDDGINANTVTEQALLLELNKHESRK